MIFFFAFIQVLTCVVHSHPKQIIDLTHTFENGYTISWPSAKEYEFKIGSRGFNENLDSWYEGNDFSQAEHSGTHIDAPSHFAKGKWRLGDIPVERLIGPGIVIDISERTKETRDTQLTVEDLTEWEKKFGIIPEGAIVIMYSGIGQFYGNKTAYFGWPAGTEENNPKDTENLHFPGISLEAAKWIVDNRNIYGTGVDTASVDYGQSKTFKTHQVFGANNIWGLENLNNVDKLPSKGFTIYNMAYKSKEGSGGPSRVIAIFDSMLNSSSNMSSSSASAIVILLITLTYFYL